jgi:cytochrome c oxidase subunit IV
MSQHEHTSTHEHGGPKAYAATLAALLVLTAITVAVAQFDFGSVNVVVALVIATIKATLVALIFMHLRWDKPLYGIMAASGFLFLGLMLMFCITDIDSRIDPTPSTLKVKPVAPKAVTPAAAPAHTAEHK